MKNHLKIKRLFKLAQDESLEAWQAVKAEVESEELPPGILDVAAIQESVSAAEKVKEKAVEAKAAVDALPPEDKKKFGEIMSSGEGWEIASTSKSASEVVDRFFVKVASEYFGKNDASKIIREINLYQSLNGLGNKVASKEDLSLILREKVAAFEAMCGDGSFYSSLAINKVSVKHQKNLVKFAEAGGIWEGIKGVGSKALELGGKALSGVGKATKYVFKFLGTIIPFVGVFWAGYDMYKAYQNVTKSVDGIKKNFSDLGNEDSLIDSEYIGSLIKKYSNDPEALLRVAQLNKVADFYKENWRDAIYSALWFIADLITSIVIICGIAATGGAATIVAPLGEMMAAALGKGAARLLVAMGLSPLIGMAQNYFGIGTGTYKENSATILALSDSAIGRLSSGSEEASSSSEGEAGSQSEEEEALEALKLLQQNMLVS